MVKSLLKSSFAILCGLCLVLLFVTTLVILINVFGFLDIDEVIIKKIMSLFLLLFVCAYILLGIILFKDGLLMWWDE